MSILAILTTLLLAGLSALHMYWAFGGRWGMESVIPTIDGRRTLNPSPLASVVVALALAVAAVVTLGSTGILRSLAPAWLVKAGLVVLTVVFLARAVGDFHTIGFTKRVRDTRFAHLDSRYFAPLCACLAVACAMLAWLCRG